MADFVISTWQVSKIENHSKST